ncbi:MAG: hypothetical protein K6B54_02230 [Clostridia bacterium]|nr:hypothetical protein [Clostridia bacterium]
MPTKYIHFTDEQRERARQRDLCNLLRSQGETLKRSGSESLKKTEEKELEYIFKDINWKYLYNDKKVSLEAFKAACDKLLSGGELTEKEQELLKYDVIYKKYPMKRKIPAKFLGKLRMRGNVEMDEDILITFSAKYYLYQRQLMQKQLEEASRWLNRNPDSIKKGPNDIRRFIRTISVTKDGELANHKLNESHF